MILMIGKLGGHIGRKSDGMPGVQAMWEGLKVMNIIVQMWIKTSGNYV
jgi:hypothetical protein